MRPTLTSASLAALALLTAGAATADPAPPAAGQAREVRALTGFTGLDLAGTLEVEARIDATTRVEVFASAALIAQVRTRVEKGVLVIETPDKLPRNSRIRVVVSAPRLDHFELSGTGALTVTGLDAGEVEVDVEGTGQIKLAGRARSLDLELTGTGEVAAKDLTVSAAKVEISGTGSAVLTARESLVADISGTGALRVHGRPAKVRKSVSGTGSIDFAN